MASALNPPSKQLNWQTALVTIASFLLLGGYGFYRESTNSNSLQELDLQSQRKITQLEKRIADLENLERQDFERIERLEALLENLRAEIREGSRVRLELPARRK